MYRDLLFLFTCFEINRSYCLNTADQGRRSIFRMGGSKSQGENRREKSQYKTLRYFFFLNLFLHSISLIFHVEIIGGGGQNDMFAPSIFIGGGFPPPPPDQCLCCRYRHIQYHLKSALLPPSKLISLPIIQCCNCCLLQMMMVSFIQWRIWGGGGGLGGLNPPPPWATK